MLTNTTILISLKAAVLVLRLYSEVAGTVTPADAAKMPNVLASEFGLAVLLSHLAASLVAK